LQQSVERAGQFELFLDDGNQQVDRDSDTYLGFDRVLAGPEEDHDAQVLLDPLEEQFHLPPALIESANGSGGQCELVGEKDQILFSLRVVKANAAQVAGVVLAAVLSLQGNGLVSQDAGLFVHLLGVDAVGIEIALGAGDKESSGQVDTIEPGVVEITAIHNVVSACLRDDLVEDVHVVHIAIGDTDTEA